MTYITFPVPTEAECIGAPSESFKYRHLCAPYLQGVGVDIGSQGASVVPWAFSVDLPEAEFLHYSGGNPPKGPIHFRCHLDDLPFADDKSLDYIYCSHVIEDFPRTEWVRIFKYWASKVKAGGVIVVLVPDHKLWWEYVRGGGVHNFSHSAPEPSVGDVGAAAAAAGLVCEREELTRVYPGDYTILAVVRVA